MYYALMRTLSRPLSSCLLSALGTLHGQHVRYDGRLTLRALVLGALFFCVCFSHVCSAAVLGLQTCAADPTDEVLQRSGSDTVFTTSWLSATHVYISDAGTNTVPWPVDALSAAELNLLQRTTGVYCVDPLSGLLYTGTNPVVVFALDYSESNTSSSTFSPGASRSRMQQRRSETLPGWATSCIFKDRNELYLHTVVISSDPSGTAGSASNAAVRGAQWKSAFSVFSRLSGKFMRTEDFPSSPPPAFSPTDRDCVDGFCSFQSSGEPAPSRSASSAAGSLSDESSAEAISSSHASSTSEPLANLIPDEMFFSSVPAAENTTSLSLLLSSSSSSADSTGSGHNAVQAPRPTIRGGSQYTDNLCAVPFVDGIVTFVAFQEVSYFGYSATVFNVVIDSSTVTVPTASLSTSTSAVPFQAVNTTVLILLGFRGSESANSTASQQAESALAASWDVVGYGYPSLEEVTAASQGARSSAGEQRSAGDNVFIPVPEYFSFARHYANAVGEVCADCVPLALCYVRAHSVVPATILGPAAAAAAGWTGDGVMVLWTRPSRVGVFVSYMARVAEEGSSPSSSSFPSALSQLSQRTPANAVRYVVNGSQRVHESVSGLASSQSTDFQWLVLSDDLHCLPSTDMRQDDYTGDVYVPLVCSPTPIASLAAPGLASSVLRRITSPTFIVNESGTVEEMEAELVLPPRWEVIQETFVLSLNVTDGLWMPAGLFVQQLTRTVEILLANPGYALQVMGASVIYVSSLDPQLIDSAGGTTLSLTGFGFVPNMQCRFPRLNNSISESVFVSASTILCAAPTALTLSCNDIGVEVKVSLDASTAEAQLVASANLPPVFVPGSSAAAFKQRTTPIVSSAVDTVSGGAFASSTNASAVQVVGAGFMSPQSDGRQKCKLWSPRNLSAVVYSTAVAYISSDEILCYFPPLERPLPSPCYLDATIDGVVYSHSGVQFRTLGPPAGLVANVTATEAADEQADAASSASHGTPALEVAAARVVLLPVITVVVVDEVGNAVYADTNALLDGYDVRLTLSAFWSSRGESAEDESQSDLSAKDAESAVTLAGTRVAPMLANGSAVFDNVRLICPPTGVLQLAFSVADTSGSVAVAGHEASRPAGASSWVALLNVTVSVGSPYKLLFVRTPSTNVTVATTLLAVQPILGLADICGNIYPYLRSGDLPGNVSIYVENDNTSTGNPSPRSWQLSATNNLFYVKNASVVGKHGRYYRMYFTAASLPSPVLRSAPVMVLWCQDDEYAITADSTCSPCPAHGTCDGSAAVIAKNGYWRYDARALSEANQTELRFPETGNSNVSVIFYSCLQPYGTGACSDNGLCQRGHSGFRCTHCVDGYRMAGKGCHRCRNVNAERFVVFLVCVVCIVLFSFWVFWMAYTDNTVSPLVWAVRLLISLFQLTGLFSLVRTEWPESLVNFFDGVYAFVHFFEVLSVCGLHVRGVQIFMFIMPIVLALVVAVVVRIAVILLHADRTDPITMSALVVVAYTHRKHEEFNRLRYEVANYVQALEAARTRGGAADGSEKADDVAAGYVAPEWVPPDISMSLLPETPLTPTTVAGGAGKHFTVRPGSSSTSGYPTVFPLSSETDGSSPPREDTPFNTVGPLEDFLITQPRRASLPPALTAGYPQEKKLLAHFEAATGLRYTPRVAEYSPLLSPPSSAQRASRSSVMATTTASVSDQGRSQPSSAALYGRDATDADERAAAQLSCSASGGISNAFSALPPHVANATDASSEEDFITVIERFGSTYQRCVSGMILRLPSRDVVQEWAFASIKATGESSAPAMRQMDERGPSGQAKSDAGLQLKRHSSTATGDGNRRWSSAFSTFNDGISDIHGDLADPSGEDEPGSDPLIQNTANCQRSPVLEGFRELALRQYRYSYVGLLVNAYASVFVVFDFVFLSNALLFQRCDTVRIFTDAEIAMSSTRLPATQSYSRASSQLSCDSKSFTTIRNLSRAVLCIYGIAVPVSLVLLSAVTRHRYGADAMFAAMPVVHFGYPAKAIFTEAILLVAKYVMCIGVTLTDAPMLQVAVVSLVPMLVFTLMEWTWRRVDSSAPVAMPTVHYSGPLGDSNTPSLRTDGSAPHTHEGSHNVKVSSPVHGKDAKGAEDADEHRAGSEPSTLSAPASTVYSARALRAQLVFHSLVTSSPRSVTLWTTAFICVLTSVSLLFTFIQVYTDNGASPSVKRFFAAVIFILFGVSVLLLAGVAGAELLYQGLSYRYRSAERAREDENRLLHLRSMCAKYRQLSLAMSDYFARCQQGIAVAEALDAMAGRGSAGEDCDFPFRMPSSSSSTPASSSTETDAAADETVASRGRHARHVRHSQQTAGKFRRQRRGTVRSHLPSSSGSDTDNGNGPDTLQPSNSASTYAPSQRTRSRRTRSTSGVDRSRTGIHSDVPSSSASTSETASPEAPAKRSARRRRGRREKEESSMAVDGSSRDGTPALSQALLGSAALSPSMRYEEPVMEEPLENANWIADPAAVRKGTPLLTPRATQGGEVQSEATPLSKEERAQRAAGPGLAETVEQLHSPKTARAVAVQGIGAAAPGEDNSPETSPSPTRDPADGAAKTETTDAAPEDATTTTPSKDTDKSPERHTLHAKTLRSPVFARVPLPVTQPDFCRASSLILSARNSPTEPLAPAHPLTKLNDYVKKYRSPHLPKVPEVSLELCLSAVPETSPAVSGPSGTAKLTEKSQPPSTQDGEQRSDSPRPQDPDPPSSAQHTKEGAASSLSPTGRLMLPHFDAAADFDPFQVPPLPLVNARPLLGPRHSDGSRAELRTDELAMWNKELNAKLFGDTAPLATSSPSAARLRQPSFASDSTNEAMRRLLHETNLLDVTGVNAADADALLGVVGLASVESASSGGVGSARTGGRVRETGSDGTSNSASRAAGAGRASGAGSSAATTAAAGTTDVPRRLPPPLQTYAALSTEVSSMTLNEPRRRAHHLHAAARQPVSKGHPRSPSKVAGRKTANK